MSHGIASSADEVINELEASEAAFRSKLRTGLLVVAIADVPLLLVALLSVLALVDPAADLTIYPWAWIIVPFLASVSVGNKLTLRALRNRVLGLRLEADQLLKNFPTAEV